MLKVNYERSLVGQSGSAGYSSRLSRRSDFDNWCGLGLAAYAQWETGPRHPRSGQHRKFDLTSPMNASLVASRVTTFK